MLRRSPIKAKRATPRRNDGRVDHKRVKPKAVAEPSLIERRHLRRVAEHGCLVCGQAAVIHHVMKCPGKARRRDDRFVAPLCPDHHNIGNASVHLLGSEDAFKRIHGVDVAAWALAAWHATETE